MSGSVWELVEAVINRWENVFAIDCYKLIKMLALSSSVFAKEELTVNQPSHQINIVRNVWIPADGHLDVIGHLAVSRRILDMSLNILLILFSKRPISLSNIFQRIYYATDELTFKGIAVS